MSDQFTSSQDDLLEVDVGLEDIEIACKEDSNFFARVALPEVCTADFPGFYVALWLSVVNAATTVRDFSKFAIGFPRGHAKTVWLKLLVCYLLIYTKKRYILVVCASEGHAKRFIKDVIEILSGENMRRIYGDWKEDVETNQAEFKQFYYRGRTIMLQAAGAGTAIRGSNASFARPDVIICDDAQTRENAESLAEARAFSIWFYGTLLKAKNPSGCVFLYVGNMYPDKEFPDKKGQYTCLLRNLKNSSTWRSYIVGAILSNGQALWEEVQPLSQLLNEYLEDLEGEQAEIFCAEVLNDPTMKPIFGLVPDRIQTKERMSGDLHQGNFVLIDPSGRKKKSNDTVIAYFEIYDGAPYCMRIKRGIYSPGQTITETLQLAIEENCTLIIAEAVAYQETLLYWFEYICLQQGFEGFAFMPIYPGSESKNSRIIKGFRCANEGEIGFTVETRALYVAQAKQFNVLKTDNVDDIIDLVAYAPRCVHEFADFLVIEGSVNHEPSNIRRIAADASSAGF